MSLKDFFSKKPKKDDGKSAKIGNKNKSGSDDFDELNTFTDEDFEKDITDGPEIDLNTLNQTELNKNHISLHTDVDDETFFNTKFNTANDFDDSPKPKNNQFEVDEQASESNKPKGKKSKKDELPSESDASLFAKQKNKTLDDLDNIDEETLLALYEQESLSKDETVSKEDDDALLQAQIKELNDLYEKGGALIEEEQRQNNSPSLDNDTLSSSKKSKSISLEDLTRDSLNDLDILTINSLEGNNPQKTNSKKTVIRKREYAKKSVFGTMTVRSQYMMFFTTLLLGMGGVASSLYVSDVLSDREIKATKLTSVLDNEVNQFAVTFRESIGGRGASYDLMLKNWSTLLADNEKVADSVFALNNSKLLPYVDSIESNIKAVSANVESIKKLEIIFKESNNQKAGLIKSVDQLKVIIDEVSSSYPQEQLTKNDLALMYSVKSSLDELKNIATYILIGNNVVSTDIVKLNQTSDLIKVQLKELFEGNAEKNINPINELAIPSYNKFVAEWDVLLTKINIISKNGTELIKVKSIAEENINLTNQISQSIKDLSNLYDGNAHGKSKILSIILILSVLLIIAGFVGVAYVYRFDYAKNELKLTEEAKKNKKAIDKLLGEMVPLQDGDLTQKTTVEEGITLDIADSINATIDSLSVVVRKIKNASFIMKNKTNEINIASMQLLNSSETQSESIIHVNESISKITKAIGEISERTKESLKIAQKSSSASNWGAKHVKDSIDSMVSISNNMDETVSLMKKVSDSSKQISEVIGLLSDITEETNILALNATVQAAKAGEAGKGFKVVADSIQELADNAAEATRRVGALIATVQTDIQSVGLSIEKTTKEVERGVERSENAGKSLNEITEISNQLAEIINTISRDAITNAQETKKISENMNQILKVTEVTRDATKLTTESIVEIDKMSSDLSESVKTFIVP